MLFPADVRTAGSTNQLFPGHASTITVYSTEDIIIIIIVVIMESNH